MNSKGYCPICGRAYRGQWEDHRCSDRVLRAIDAAHEHADDEDRQEPIKPLAFRLADGCAILDMADDDEN